jgi:hypothetical protein
MRAFVLGIKKALTKSPVLLSDGADKGRMPVYVIRAGDAIALPGLPENFVITQAALIETKVQTHDTMCRVINTAVQSFI